MESVTASSVLTVKATSVLPVRTAMRLGGKVRLSPGNAVTRMIVGDTTSSRTFLATPAAGVTTMPSEILTYEASAPEPARSESRDCQHQRGNHRTGCTGANRKMVGQKLVARTAIRELHGRTCGVLARIILRGAPTLLIGKHSIRRQLNVQHLRNGREVQSPIDLITIPNPHELPSPPPHTYPPPPARTAPAVPVDPIGQLEGHPRMNPVTRNSSTPSLPTNTPPSGT